MYRFLIYTLTKESVKKMTRTNAKMYVDYAATIEEV